MTTITVVVAHDDPGADRPLSVVVSNEPPRLIQPGGKMAIGLPDGASIAISQGAKIKGDAAPTAAVAPKAAPKKR